MDIVEYSEKYKKEWDDFITNSRNGVFFFSRDYIKYHKDRFVDNSLMFFDNKKLISVIPLNIYKNMLYSHGGLSFGGMVFANKISVLLIEKIFSEMYQYMKQNKISNFIYKSIPYIYHKHPSDEDIFYLHKIGAKIVKRNISFVINMKNRMDFSVLRKRCIKKSIKEGIYIRKSNDYNTYWKILTENLLKRHNVSPLHSLKEIEYLKEKFPNNIKLFAAYKNNEMIAGVVIYENATVVRAQYISSNSIGRKYGALDLIFEYLINENYTNKNYFDLGVSTETYLPSNKLKFNKGLVFQKESFGARSVIYDIYELNI